MWIIFFRTLFVFITLVIVMRIMGKRQIGEMQPFEFVVTLIIADLACIPMSDVSIPLLYGVVSIICLFLLHQLLSLLEQSGTFTRKIISGKPSLVIDKRGVNLKELKKNNMGINELIESMRSAGFFSLDDVYYAIYESNGKLSALENTEKNKSSSLPLLLIGNGKSDKGNCNSLDISPDELTNYLKDIGSDIKKTEVMTMDGDGRVYLKEKNKSFRILHYPLKATK